MQINWNDTPTEDHKMFSDLLLNRKANNIINIIVKEQQKMANGDIMKLYGEFGASYAKTLLDSCLDDLEYIKSNTGFQNEQLILISDTLAITVGLMVKMFAANILVKINNSSLKNKEVEQTFYFLNISEQVMKIVLSFNLSARAKAKVNENFNVVKNAKDILGPFSKKDAEPLEKKQERIGIYIMIAITIIFAIFGAMLGGVGGVIFCSCIGMGVGRVIGGLISGFIN